MDNRKVIYFADELECHGHLIFDETRPGPQPTVMITPPFDGLNTFVLDYASRVAELGYTVFCIDYYGKRQTATTMEACMALYSPLAEDRLLLQKRMLASFEACRTQAEVDETRIAVLGFCCGGLFSLDLARVGADVKGVVALHSALAEPKGVPQGEFKAKVLVMNGYDDPQVTNDQLHVFAKEMNAKNVDWQFHFFSHTKHSYTDPDAAKIGRPEFGRVYNALSTARAFEFSAVFLKEVLA